jgi:hypothetical protein
MNKKSAMAIAAGLVAAMLAGTAAFSLSMNSTGTAAASGATPSRPKPIVKTVEHTVTIHKKAKDQSSESRVVVLPVPSSGSGSDVSSGSSSGGGDQYDDRYEGSDDQYEDEGDEGHGYEDHSGGGEDGFEGGDD